MTLIAITANVYNALLLNGTRLEIEKILGKTRAAFEEIDSQPHSFWLSVESSKATLLLVDFSKAFDSIHRGKIEQILLAYGLPKETVM